MRTSHHSPWPVTHTGVTVQTGTVAAKRLWNLTLSSEKYITSREVLLKRRKAGSTPRPWAQKILKPQLTCFTLTGKKATLQIMQLLPTVKISSTLKTVALQSAYCPLAFIWQDSGQEEASERRDEGDIGHSPIPISMTACSCFLVKTVGFSS